MLFNSAEFLFLFLPFTFLVFAILKTTRSIKIVVGWLIIASLFFHAYWKSSYTWILVLSIIINYVIGRLCFRRRDDVPNLIQKISIVLGISFNICLLGYFKYARFFADTTWQLTSIFLDVGTIVLPLAISFYTFQQIAFLVDSYRGNARHYTFFEYASYLAFFPHLIAGPIVKHDNLINQLNSPRILSNNRAAIMSGIVIIIIGLFKKVVIADGAAQYVDPIFLASEHGQAIGFVDGWLGAVLFSFVIYFDFSGYSDIAIGLARIFNVRFPENFASPYKARTIADFWRRWHITLSVFLRDYVYIPLGGGRSGPSRQSVNLLATMLLGGLWHGAGWNFVIWGGLHGLYLTAFHMWRRRVRPAWLTAFVANPVFARTLTYLAVVVAWVFFRSHTFDGAHTMLSAMAGLQGFLTGLELQAGPLGDGIMNAIVLAAVLLVLVNKLPNTQEYMVRFRPVLIWHRSRTPSSLRYLAFFPNMLHMAFAAVLGITAMSQIGQVQAFIYFRF